MPDFKSTDVDSDQIVSTSSGIGGNVAEMQAIRAVLEKDILSNLAPCWKGNASHLFEQKFAVFTAEFSRLTAGYAELNAQLQKAGMTYGKADNTAKQLISNL